MNKQFYSNDTERSVLGALLIDNSSIDDSFEIKVDDFYIPQHKLIFDAIVSLIQEGKNADILTVSQALSEEKLRSCGGLAYLAELTRDTPRATNYKYYVSILRNYTKARSANNIAKTLIKNLSKASFSDSDSSNQIIAKTESELFQLGHAIDNQDEQLIPAMLSNLMTFLETEHSPFIPTFFKNLDSKIGGLEPKEITIIAARPSMGKTAFLISMIYNQIIALNDNPNLPKQPIFVFSLEMDSQSLMLRLLAALAHVPFIDIKNKNLDDSDYGKISQAIAILLKLKKFLIIDDNAHLTPSIFRRKVQRYIRLYGQPTFVAVDYVQLMSSGEKNNENRAVEVSNISRQLKIHCKDFNIPLVLLSQLNRSVESRSDKHPLLSDLKESGSLEQDATTVILLYRDEVYNENSECKGTGELIVAKARNAATGKVVVKFDGPYMHYQNLV
ncbi:replicative DNA helicase [Gilliamella sp. B2776]|uniref:replicative DNA helicase n=1 Tax=unclassified Gilliamella TaxID=2685620 RepID=UPI00226A9D37|nr:MULTISPECIES: replicative DNA helicase [unclassified Gilliamella]MCX8578728.1 replicative DNA helicase [Gilliamella sp. B2717]MCX8649610.1 replicative DNA helicase [Gilliamella sp. B2779]MCX8654872.1 replicative DNA helicase [Gilliamella sp. B2737]MCX8691400.1 replicative DNA helicase [Gilliamella sp. B2776]MCX8702539.1 replicative DNA helicase [Gilliamella sp. B2781]